MKKNPKLIPLALTLVLALALGLAACGTGPAGSGETVGPRTYMGEHAYPNAYNATGDWYGAKVDVTVNNGVITNVRLYTVEEAGGLIRTSQSWENFATTEAAYPEFLRKCVGMSVADVMAITVTVKAAVSPVTGVLVVGEPNKIGNAPGDLVISGATQSAGRVILAVQDALRNPAVK